jgi:PAS domain S-box-containing protein
MHWTRTFMRQNLLPGAAIIILFACAVILFLKTWIPVRSWTLYILVTDLFLILLLFAFIFRNIMKVETQRQSISGRIGEADEKYRSLLETSAEGTLIIMNRDIVQANLIFLAMSGYTLGELMTMKFEELVQGKEKEPVTVESLYRELDEPGRTKVLESVIRCKRNETREVVLAVSRINLEGKNGLLLISKDISGRERLELESSHLRNELHSAILMMNLPVSSFTREFLVCNMDLPIREAAQRMQRKGHNAIIISKERDNPVGILTDSDLRNRVIIPGKNYEDPVFEIMSSPLVRIPDQALLYEGILKIQENNISHLVAEDRNGKITGIFSTEDLLEVQRNSISYLIREVDAAETVEALRKIHNKIPVLVKILLESGARIKNITYMISTVTDAITRRLIGFAIEEMGEPPARFALMALGSEGRREQTLVTDQDNAIIFEDLPNEKLSEVSRYFLYFGKKINLWLDRIGYQYCKGEVMAGNPQWCQPVSRWENYFTDWITRKSDTGILGAAVFFDFRIVYGEEQFGRELRQYINRTVSGKDALFTALAREIASYEIPVNIFRSNGTEAAVSQPETFNVKNALSPLTGFIRIYALHNRISESNSLQRLEKLMRLNIIPANECQEIENMLGRLMEIRFRSQVNAILANRSPDNMVAQDELTPIEQTMVQKSFSEIKRYQGMITETFGS